METLSAVAFIGTIVVAGTQAVKLLVPQVNGAATILVAAILGLLVAAVDVHIGLNDISLALGVLTGLGASGVVTLRRGE